MSTGSGSEPVGDGAVRRGRIRQRLIRPLAELLATGLAPRPLALAVATGAVIGCMPLIWGTSLLCVGAALLLRLNPVAVQVGNYAAWPLQIFLAYPYLKWGSSWFADLWGTGDVPVPATPADLPGVVAAASGAALSAWAVTVPLLLPVLYILARLLIALFRPADA